MGEDTRKRGRGPRAGIADGIGARGAWGSRSQNGEEAEGLTREQKYTEQLKALGVWQEAFAPEITMLAMMERELQRMVKAWKAAGSPVTDETANGSPTSNRTWDAIAALRRDILAHRDSLGLTPKGLHRLRRGAGTGTGDADKPDNVLTLIRSRREKGA